MSELINNGQQRLEDLTDFARGLLRYGEGRILYDKHKASKQAGVLLIRPKLKIKNQ